MATKYKPHCFQSTQYAQYAQEFSFVIECVVFALTLVAYLQQYSLTTEIYTDWEQRPIVTMRQVVGECAAGEEVLLNLEFSSTNVGCYCGETQFDKSQLLDRTCTEEELEQKCEIVDAIDSQIFRKWPGFNMCGTRATKTYRELRGECDNAKCQHICLDSCPLDQLQQFNINTLIYDITIDYSKQKCGDDWVDTNYPLLYTADDVCDELDWHYQKLADTTQQELFKVNGYDTSSLVGYDDYTNSPTFSLYAVKFTLYSCDLEQINLPEYRDNQIQITGIVALILSGCLPGVGAIGVASIMVELRENGLSWQKAYQVSGKYYVKSSLISTLYLINCACLSTLLAYVVIIQDTIQEYISKGCTDDASANSLNSESEFIKNNIQPYVIAALALCSLGLFYEVSQCCSYVHRDDTRPTIPSLQLNTNYVERKQYQITLGMIPEDNSVKNIVVSNDNVQIGRRNEQLQTYNA